MYFYVEDDNIRVSSLRMSERKFTRALGKPGMAAQLRETVSQVVRESAVQVSVDENYLQIVHIYLSLLCLFIIFIFSNVCRSLGRAFDDPRRRPLYTRNDNSS